MRHVALALAVLSCAALNAGEPPLILSTPAMSRTQVAFAYGGEIWTVPREGGEARLLIGGPARSGHPIFSPDGSRIAYTAYDNGNVDVYVVDAAGGQPRRLTYHPAADVAMGWTPDGRRVVFESDRHTTRDLPQLYTVGLGGGLPQELPLPSGTQASYSPDGTHLAYLPYMQWEPEWKMYRGGQTTPIWIADLSDSSIVKVPRDNSNDRDPMWVGDKVYFVSDRDGRFTLFSYDTRTTRVEKLFDNDGFDIKSASAGPGGIVFTQFGGIHVYDFATGRVVPVPIRISADIPARDPRFERVKPDEIMGATLSPTGKRAAFEAHGEILTLPAEKGDARNLTQSPGVADRDPSWSPDGKSIAYFSDESGEYALHITPQDGLGGTRKIGLGDPPSYFYAPTWSPDSNKIEYTDKRLHVWYVPAAGGAPVLVDTDLYDTPLGSLSPSWSPDGRWLTYCKQLPNHLHAIFVYSLTDRSIHQLTDGLSDATSPVFDRNGKYLYFTASTVMALTSGWLDMTSFGHPVVSNVYAAVLRRDVPSPVAPESDDENADGDKKGPDKAKDSPSATPTAPPGPSPTPSPTPTATPGRAAEGPMAGAEAMSVAPATKGAAKDAKDDKDDSKDKPQPVDIDFDGIDQRIVSMPLASANYSGLAAGKDGVLFAVFGPSFQDPDGDGGTTYTVTRFDLKDRKPENVAEDVSFFGLSADGEKMLVSKDGGWFIQDSDKADTSGKGALAVEKLEVYVDPPAEWRQMYHEVWRIERDFFYDPGHHGLDLSAAEKLYRPFLDTIASRDDLNALFGEMTGWMVSGHLWAGGGWHPETDHVAVGLLGADYSLENGRYRIAKIYPGENWNPKLESPLTRPGVKVREGDYVLAVNGRNLSGDDEIYRLFQETAGKQTVIRVGPNPDDRDAHNETVIPIESEGNLRYRAWIEGNRQKVEKLSGGRLAYVHIPDTGGEGYTNFNRYFFAQVGKEGAILDERFNHGGSLADYIVEYLNRPVLMINASRDGEDYAEPAEAIHGPKVMLINQMSGSGGDALPWIFRLKHAGKLVGVRTWGGLIGIGGYPQLIDGGSITAPRWGLYGTNGKWTVENHGIAPDVEVEMDPKLVRQGHDPQLERAVSVALDELAKNPPRRFERPAYPNYHQRLPASADVDASTSPAPAASK
ncbi:MAG TPA: PDZ domain-containing protein [Opitutaceae bacterium]|jgi:tricorn protease